MSHATSLLLIEDDPGVAHSLQAALEREGYSVAWKTSGTEGLDYARAHDPHLIILDVRLPDGSGFDVCRRLRDAGLGLEMGADDYMLKPFSLRELISRVRALLRRAYGELASANADLLYAGDLVIDVGRSQVRRGQRLINLTPIEFRLLTHLARHAGQTLSRAQILDAVWGYDADVESENTVYVHVRRLREKIEPDPGNPSLILTVPGIGYRLAD
jgi:DNA-binding response OmpR family regulator